MNAATVILLTQPNCAMCEHAKTVLASLSRDYPLRIQEVALDSVEGTAMAATGGVLFAPGVFLDGRLFGYGRLSERKLRKALERRASDTAIRRRPV